jgi:DNA (cytosine-5)-methyltransferase 1
LAAKATTADSRLGRLAAVSRDLAGDGRAIPVVDIFAGPGGLGEGFSAFRAGGAPRFDIRLSVEKDRIACETLRLRKFSRLFEEPPPELRSYYRGGIPLTELFDTYPSQTQAAAAAVWHAELGKVPQASVNTFVRQGLRGATNWVLLGGPPCQAYSVAGRSRMRSTRPDFDRDERHFLYREYLRIVADHEPAVFVLENVKGLLTSKHGHERMVTRILEDLWAPARALGLARPDARGYRLYALAQRQAALPWSEDDPADGEEFVVKAEEFGVPQMRHRIFIIGVRSDIHPHRPASLECVPEIAAGEVLSDLPRIRARLSRESDCLESWRDAVGEIENYRFMAGSEPGLVRVLKEIRRVTSQLGRTDLRTGAAYVPYRSQPRALADWYRKHAFGLMHHESRAHMRSDFHRYLFVAAFGRVYGRSPELQDLPKELQPAHDNVEHVLAGGEMFNDRFRVQLQDRPSTTITSHISKDGHYYIHYDPLQCRSLTVREAARLQTFPDNYYFAGDRTPQYHQVGNAVPPLLAHEIARVIYDLLSRAGLAPRVASSTGTRRHRSAATRSGEALGTD